MPPSDDFVDPLVEEILGDAADKFFSQRRSLEFQIDLFSKYEEALRIKKRMLERRAATVNALLLDKPTAADFYRRLGIEDAGALVEVGASEPDLGSLQIPFAVTFGGRFRKLVAAAYARLQRICREYLHGPANANSGQPESEEAEVPAYYFLVKNMAQILNREIARVNCNMSASCTLQFAKGLASDLGDKQKVTGSAASEYSTLDEKMTYPQLDLNADGIKAYPELPPRDAVAGKIRRFCRKLQQERPEEIRRTLAKISEMRQGADSR